MDKVNFDNEREWRKYLVSRVDCLEAKVVKGLQEARVEIAVLKTKAGIWGAIGGMIPVAIIIALWFLERCHNVRVN